MKRVGMFQDVRVVSQLHSIRLLHSILQCLMLLLSTFSLWTRLNSSQVLSQVSQNNVKVLLVLVSLQVMQSVVQYSHHILQSLCSGYTTSVSVMHSICYLIQLRVLGNRPARRSLVISSIMENVLILIFKISSSMRIWMCL